MIRYPYNGTWLQKWSGAVQAYEKDFLLAMFRSMLRIRLM